MASVKVFGSPEATEVARVLTCLLEKEVDFQLIRMDTYKGEHKVPEFIKLKDPSGQVTYKEGDKTLLESREICRYISDKYSEQGNKKLLGAGTLERASIEQWLQAEATNFDPPSSALVFHLAFAPPININPNPTVIDELEEKVGRVLDIYDEKLGESEFLAGDDFTLADLSHLPNSYYLMNRTVRGRRLFETRKNVSRWWKAISSRTSWKMVAQMLGETPPLPVKTEIPVAS